MDIRDLLQKHDPPEPPEEGAPAWYVSFADMATLLMATFLMMLSFASMDLKKFNKMLGSVHTALKAESPSVVPPPALPLAAPAAPAPAPREKALSIVEGIFEGVDGAEVVEQEGGITVRLEGKVLFQSGAAELRPEAGPVLDRIGLLLAKYTFDLYILGHTDSTPIGTSQFASNWELSAARAARALRYLAEAGASPERLVAVGFADSRPVAANDTPEGRARNRRVEFVFKNPDQLEGGGFKPAGF